MDSFDRLTVIESRLYAARCRLAIRVIAIGTLLLLAFFNAFAPNRPVDHASEVAHFYYGSIGSDLSSGVPLKVMQVLPQMFPEHLPSGAKRHDYTAFGFIQEKGRPMPIGFSIRRRFIDMTQLNCAACHTGSVRETTDSEPAIIAAMPANTVDLLAFFEFLFTCADDRRFNAQEVVTAFDEAGLSDPLDPVIYSVVIPIMRDRLLERRRKLRFLYAPDYTAFGPGRVNTFDTFKFDQFSEYYASQGWEVGPEELFGVVDFPSVWNQIVRQGMQLHWDGNNTLVRERNFSAAIGAGTKPRDMDLPRLFRLEKWLGTLPPPPYPFAINTELARQGEAIYKQYCFDCHDIRGSRVGTVFDLSEIGTDRYRVLSYTQRTLEAQQDYTKGFDWSFSHFSNTNGYASHPLDGIWARAPYLHGGSVPTMWDLLSPADERPAAFTTGGDVYDQDKLGFVVERLTKNADGTFRQNDGSPYDGSAFVLDTTLRANGNQGHSGARYGTDLSDDEKRALIEYLKYQDHPSQD